MNEDHLLENMPEIALRWHRAGRGAAVATVIETWGSAPRPAGSQLVVDRDGVFQGSVSGGCVEGAVVIEAQEALGDGRPRVLTFGVSEGDAFSAGLACGGTIKVLVEPVIDAAHGGQGLSIETLERLVQARAERRAVTYNVNLTRWTRDLRPSALNDVTGVEGDIFSSVYHPRLRLVIIGAVHIAQALLPMARQCGFDPLVIDPRDSFAADQRFPSDSILREWPDEALPTIGLDAHTGLVVLSHDAKIDDPALVAGLTSDAFYIGALGSKKTQEERRQRMRDAGFSDAQIARIHGPVGLDIGSIGPAEIAVSIMAQIVAVLRERAV